ncbi:hypothetical protein LIER_39651 [Lithospermum erythrorhizon]|uniref:HAT C-terminal dimerisation domain-containing protein n=1 Tax=Lithospermum erythrorhizon TaxID=34254 RepID=A0AAV3QI44_LITER
MHVETKFEELYNQYAKIFDDEKGDGETMSCGEKLKQSPSSTVRKRKYHEFMMTYHNVGKVKTELELCFEEACHPDVANLNVLHYWKVNEGKYKVLSKMARDILSIPITTVASESTLSVRGRVISQKRASTRVGTIEVNDPDELRFFKEYNMLDKNSTVEATNVLRNSSPPLRSRSRHVEFAGREKSSNQIIQQGSSRNKE